MTIEQIKSQIQYGDYNTLAKILEVQNSAAARARFLRGDLEAKAAMEKIIESRETLIENFKKSE